MEKNTKNAIATYKNALSKYEPMIANLKLQLEDKDITEELRKDLEAQLKQAEEQVESITTSLKILETKEDK